MGKIIHSELYVIGAGGTGSYFLKEISSYLAVKYSQQPRVVVDAMYIYDGDIVEEKNLTRQTVYDFDDVGLSKSDAIAEKLNIRDWNDKRIQWQSFTEYVLPGCSLEEHINRVDTSLKIIVCCVDNHAARLYLSKLAVSCKKDVLFIDTANNDTTCGEVFITPVRRGKKQSMFRQDLFPAIKKDTRPVTEISCEELNTVKPQHQFTNMESASIATHCVSKFIETLKIEGGVIFFDTSEYMKKFKPLPVSCSINKVARRKAV